MEQSLVTLDKCPSCGHESFQKQLSAIDYTYSQDAFDIVKCPSCTLLFTNPRPSESAIGEYYDNPDYVSHTDTNKGLLFSIYSAVKSHAIKRKRHLLERHASGRKVLDYGAGTGDFSVELTHNNWNVSSYEPNANAREKIRSKSDTIRIVESINDIDSNSLSAITLWHVLEHVHTLNQTLRGFNKLLDANGCLIIAVPNCNSFDAEYYKSDWAAYDVPRHLYHFEYGSMKTLVEKHGFILETTKPMWFDSTYVSLLSERNKNPSGLFKSIIGWIRASIIGTLSNVQTLNDTSRCSSIIYIFKKAT